MRFQTTMVLRENADGGAVVSWHQDGMPAHRSEQFADVSSARTAHPVAWQPPDADADGDVIAVYTF